MRRAITGVVILSLILTGCASASSRIVSFPIRGQTAEQQAKDVQECEVFAEANKSNEEVLRSIGIATVGGAASGVLAGAVLGALGTGGAGRGAGLGAAVGATTGLIAGAWSALSAEHQRYFRVYAACMAHRGYDVAG